MSDTPRWLEAFPRDRDAAHERRVPGRAAKVVHGPDAAWPGRLDEVHLRSGPVLHRVELRHGRTVSEPAPW